MQTQSFRNLVPDVPATPLVEETIRLLHSSGGRAPATEVCACVLEMADLEPKVAAALVAELIGEDWRLRVCDGDSCEVEVLCEDDERRALSESEFVVFDIETTGPKMPPSRVMEIGAARVRDGRIVDEFQTLVNPLMPIPPFIANLTGIRDEMVAGAPTFDEIAADWLDFADTAVLVAHNAVFDVRFINHEVGHVFPGRRMMNSHICTVSLARQLLPELKSFRLAALADHFAVPHRSRHRAGDDALATACVFIRLLEHLDGHGVRDLSGARRFKKLLPVPSENASEVGSA